MSFIRLASFLVISLICMTGFVMIFDESIVEGDLSKEGSSWDVLVAVMQFKVTGVGAVLGFLINTAIVMLVLILAVIFLGGLFR